MAAAAAPTDAAAAATDAAATDAAATDAATNAAAANAAAANAAAANAAAANAAAANAVATTRGWAIVSRLWKKHDDCLPQLAQKKPRKTVQRRYLHTRAPPRCHIRKRWHLHQKQKTKWCLGTTEEGVKVEEIKVEERKKGEKEAVERKRKGKKEGKKKYFFFWSFKWG